MLRGWHAPAAYEAAAPLEQLRSIYLPTPALSLSCTARAPALRPPRHNSGAQHQSFNSSSCRPKQQAQRAQQYKPCNHHQRPGPLGPRQLCYSARLVKRVVPDAHAALLKTTTLLFACRKAAFVRLNTEFETELLPLATTTLVGAAMQQGMPTTQELLPGQKHNLHQPTSSKQRQTLPLPVCALVSQC